MFIIKFFVVLNLNVSACFLNYNIIEDVTCKVACMFIIKFFVVLNLNVSACFLNYNIIEDVTCKVAGMFININNFSYKTHLMHNVMV